MEEIGISWTIVGWLALVAGLVILVHSLIKTYLARHDFNKYYEMLMILFAMYPLGNGIKYLIIGPSFIRHHLVDFGFTAFWAIGLSWFMWDRVSAMQSFDDLPRHEKDKIWIKIQPRAVIIALLLSLCWEFFTEFLYTASNLEVAIMGRFDPIDVLAYFLGAGSCYILTKLYGNGLMQLNEQYRVLSPAEQAEQREAARKAELAARRARREKKG